jgi:hypothetical protein
VTVGRLLQVLSIIEPIVEDVANWLEGSDPEPPATLKALPPELKSEIELRLLRARAASKE